MIAWDKLLRSSFNNNNCRTRVMCQSHASDVTCGSKDAVFARLGRQVQAEGSVAGVHSRIYNDCSAPILQSQWESAACRCTSSTLPCATPFHCSMHYIRCALSHTTTVTGKLPCHRTSCVCKSCCAQPKLLWSLQTWSSAMQQHGSKAC